MACRDKFYRYIALVLDIKFASEPVSTAYHILRRRRTANEVTEGAHISKSAPITPNLALNRPSIPRGRPSLSTPCSDANYILYTFIGLFYFGLLQCRYSSETSPRAGQAHLTAPF